MEKKAEMAKMAAAAGMAGMAAAAEMAGMAAEDYLQPGERLDDTGFGGLLLLQKPDAFCYGIDAVLLADFAAGAMKEGARCVVDLGTGTGILPLILSYKTKAARIIGVEVQEDSWDRARRTCALNGLTARLSFLLGDVKHWKTGPDGGDGWGRDLAGQVDTVVSNPPYVQAQSGIPSCGGAKRIARHETTADLGDFLACGAGLLREKGDMFLVHRPARLADICCLGRERGLEVKTLRFVAPRAGEAPNLVLVQLVKGGGRQVRVLPELIVREADGSYTQALRQAYR